MTSTRPLRSRQLANPTPSARPKARFLTALDVRALTDERWVLLAPLVYESARVPTIFVPTGFLTDFASVPRLPLVYWVAGGRATGPAVVHDWLYTTRLYPRSVADAVFRDAMEAWGTPRILRWLLWAGVWQFGAAAWAAHEALAMRMR